MKKKTLARTLCKKIISCKIGEKGVENKEKSLGVQEHPVGPNGSKGLEKWGCEFINWIPFYSRWEIQGEICKYNERLEFFVIIFYSLLGFFSCDFM